MPQHPITPDEALAAYVAGETIQQIADRVGTSRGTIWRRVNAAGGITRRQGPPRSPRTLTVPTDPAVLGYIAGMFDGEGNLYWRRLTDYGCSVRVTIYSTTPEVIEWLHTTMGGVVRWDHKRTERRGWKPMGSWVVSRAADVDAILSALLPYLIIKRDAATQALRLLRREPPSKVKSA